MDSKERGEGTFKLEKKFSFCHANVVFLHVLERGGRMVLYLLMSW